VGGIRSELFKAVILRNFVILEVILDRIKDAAGFARAADLEDILAATQLRTFRETFLRRNMEPNWL
jgi:hypothetical protein